MRTTAIGLVAVASSCLFVAPPARAQPAGSYAATCRDSRASGGVLSARCLDARGRLHSSSLGYTTCRGDISNQNGVLSCPGGTPAAGRSDDYYPQGGDVRRSPRDRGYGPNSGYPDRGGDYGPNPSSRDRGGYGPTSNYPDRGGDYGPNPGSRDRGGDDR
jgi:hypothetical protein